MGKRYGFSLISVKMIQALLVVHTVLFRSYGANNWISQHTEAVLPQPQFTYHRCY